MSTHLEAERRNLKDLFGQAAAKERRFLRFSIIFTLVVIAAGFGWIAYSANRVIKLEQRRAALEASNTDLEDKINKNTELLRQVESALDSVDAPLKKIAQGKSDAKQEARSALASISNAQERVHVVIEQAPANRGTEGPLSTPTSPTLVPDVKGLNFANARQRLRQAQLTVTQKVQEGNGAPGTVLYQDPIPGTRAPVGSSVNVYVAPVMVPDLKGLTAAAASQRVRDVGLGVTQKTQEGRGAPGKVLYQDPVAGTRLPAGASVILYVIPGPN